MGDWVTATPLCFGDCELDLAAFELRRGGEVCPVEPQVFELLAFLARNPGRLVTKDELIAEVWGGRIVSDAALASRIKSARRAIGDDGAQQRLIRTVHGRGIRFLGDVAGAPEPAPSAEAAALPGPGPAAVPLFGRAAELDWLRARLGSAATGRRQTVFVTGDTGVGKTTLLEAFLRQAEAGPGLRVGHGQCLEHRGVGEAYMPVLEALSRLCRRADGGAFVAQLRDRAPSWLAQMPWLISPAEQEALQRRTSGNARERMLREIVEALEMASAEMPLVLVLEDLHWSDPSTVDLVARLAQRREAARLLVIGTYRPSELRAGDHPLRNAVQELRRHGACEELTLPLLAPAAVAEYLADRFPARGFPAGFTELLFERTEGNPLFMANLVETWLARGQLAQKDGRWTVDGPMTTLAVGVPDNLRQLIEQNLERLAPDERALLEAGSVAGREFAVAVAAAAMERAEEELDGIADDLARQVLFLRLAGTEEWPDGTVTPRYAFRHDFYREVLYGRLPPTRAMHLHRRIGLRLETGYGANAADHAAELAAHFRRGRKATRAIRYGRIAAERALRRGAHGEALAHLDESAAALPRVDDPGERRALEFGLQIARATAAIAAHGYAADETESAYRRAWELSSAPTPDRRYFQAGFGLFVVRWNRAWLVEAASIAQELADTANGAADDTARCVAHRAIAVAANALGDFERAREHGGRALAAYQPERDRDSAAEFAHHIGVAALTHRALADWHLGHREDALTGAADALAVARRLEHANTLAYALYFNAYLQLLGRRGDAAMAYAAELVPFADERFMEYWAGTGRCALGAAAVIGGDWARGQAHLRDGLDRLEAAQIAIFRPTFLGFLAEAEAGLGRPEMAAEYVRGALELVRTTQERWFEPQLHGLGEKLAGRRP